MCYRKNLCYVLFIPLVVYSMVALFWVVRDMNIIAGDEPHYLMIAESLVYDGDMVVANNYQTPSAVRQAHGAGLSPGAHVAHGVSVHAPGLGMLLALPYAVGGVMGAKIALVLLTGLWPFLLYRSLLDVLHSRVWALVFALTLSLSLPFTAAANQIYPDLLGGLLIFVLAIRLRGLLLPDVKCRVNGWEQLGLGVGMACLPWLHMRLIAPAGLFLLAYVCAGHRCAGKRASSSRWMWFLPAVSFSLLIMPLLAFNALHFGHLTGWFGAHSLNLSLRHGTMLFLGLHWDQAQGMFLQQPLLLLGLLGMPAWLKRERRFALVLSGVYLSVVLPNSMHGVYGGWSFWGRFGWTVLALWVFPLAHALKLIKEHSRLVLGVICVLVLSYQAYLASKWLLRDEFLYQRTAPFWSPAAWSLLSNDALSGIWTQFPVFQTPDVYLHHPANYVFPVWGGAIFLLGVLLLHHRFRLAWIVLGSAVCAGMLVLFTIPAVPGSWVLYPHELPADVGQVTGWTRVALHGRDAAGDIVLPHAVDLPAGSYLLKVAADIDHAQTSTPLHWELFVDAPQQTLVKGNAKELPVSFDVSPSMVADGPVWIRLWYAGVGDVVLRRLYISPRLRSSLRQLCADRRSFDG